MIVHTDTQNARHKSIIKNNNNNNNIFIFIFLGLTYHVKIWLTNEIDAFVLVPGTAEITAKLCGTQAQNSLAMQTLITRR